jgi:hypothetical protein
MHVHGSGSVCGWLGALCHIAFRRLMRARVARRHVPQRRLRAAALYRWSAQHASRIYTQGVRHAGRVLWLRIYMFYMHYKYCAAVAKANGGSQCMREYCTRALIYYRDVGVIFASLILLCAALDQHDFNEPTAHPLAWCRLYLFIFTRPTLRHASIWCHSLAYGLFHL